MASRCEAMRSQRERFHLRGSWGGIEGEGWRCQAFHSSAKSNRLPFPPLTLALSPSRGEGKAWVASLAPGLFDRILIVIEATTSRVSAGVRQRKTRQSQ